jgi:hypothetical protein
MAQRRARQVWKPARKRNVAFPHSGTRSNLARLIIKVEIWPSLERADYLWIRHKLCRGSIVISSTVLILATKGFRPWPLVIDQPHTIIYWWCYQRPIAGISIDKEDQSVLLLYV